MTDSSDKTKKTSLSSSSDLSGLFQTMEDTEYNIEDTTVEVLAERKRFQMFTDSIPFGIALIDKNGFHTYLNPKFIEMFGYELKDIPNRETWFEKA